MIWLLVAPIAVVVFLGVYAVVDDILVSRECEETRRRNARQTSDWLASHPFRK